MKGYVTAGRVVAALAGAVAAAGILYGAGLRPAWLERFHLEWMISSDRLAERAYAELLRGSTREGVADFERAVRRDPASPDRWCDLAEALLADGERERAWQALRRGVELGPYIATVRMRAVNFAYRTGDGVWALEQGSHLLAMTEAYDDAVFGVWERMEVAPGEVLRAGILDRRSAQAYLRKLMGGPALRAAGEVWSWLLQRDWVEDRLADEYAGSLLRAHEVETAAAAWRTYAGGREPGYPERNAVFNGGFEREPAGGVFDWRVEQVEGARAERDPRVAAEGKYSLRLEFDGTQNLNYGQVSQRAAVRPGEYMFEARVRTQAVTTDQGIGFRIVDAEAPQRLTLATGRLTGTNEWTALRERVRVPAGTRVLEIRIVREASWKFDNKLGGTVWVDAVGLRSVF